MSPENSAAGISTLSGPVSPIRAVAPSSEVALCSGIQVARLAASTPYRMNDDHHQTGGPIPRRILARTVSLSGLYYLLQGIAGTAAGGFILAFHGIEAQRFSSVIEALHPNQPVHLSELIERNKKGRKTSGLFSITLDDGVGVTVRNIAAVLEARQWPATFYLPTDYLDNREGMPFQWWSRLMPYLPRQVIALPSGSIDLSGPRALSQLAANVTHRIRTRPAHAYVPLIMELAEFLVKDKIVDRAAIEPPAPVTWDEAARLTRSGLIGFESHGVSHQAVVALTEEELAFEMHRSQQLISDHTNRVCRHFCYPFGGKESIGDSAARIAARYYDSAVTLVRGRIRGRDSYMLPRIPIYARDSASVTRLKVLTV